MNYIQTITRQLNSMAQSVVASLPSIVIAITVLIVTWILSKFAVNIAHRIVGRTHIRNDLRALVETLVRLTIWIVGLLLAAAVAIPGFTPASMIAGLGVGALAIGFAFQDIFENFLAGVLIMLRDKMNIGDYVEAQGASGTVEHITLRETHIRQFSGELTILPNSMIFKNPVKIFTDAPERRTDVIVGVDYGADLSRAEQVIRDAVKSVPTVSTGRAVDVFASEFGASSVDLLVRWWTNTKDNNILQVKHDVMLAIKAALDNAGIEIPFPHVTHTFPEGALSEKVFGSDGLAVTTHPPR